MTDKVRAFTVLNLLVELVDGKQIYNASTRKKDKSKGGNESVLEQSGSGGSYLK